MPMSQHCPPLAKGGRRASATSKQGDFCNCQLSKYARSHIEYHVKQEDTFILHLGNVFVDLIHRASKLLPMPKHILTFLLIGLSLLPIGCAHKTAAVSERGEDEAVLLERARQLYEAGKHNKALETLDKVRYSASVLADDAHLLAAKIYIAQKDYPLATSELKWLLGQYPQSDCREEGAFLLGEAYRLESPRAELEQTFTQNAIESYNDFLDRYPSSKFADSAVAGIALCKNKLAHKQYLAAELYCKLKQDSSAIIYINDIRENYPDTKWRLWADYLEATIKIRQDDCSSAKAALDDLLVNNPDAKLRKKAEKAMRKCE